MSLFRGSSFSSRSISSATGSLRLSESMQLGGGFGGGQAIVPTGGPLRGPSPSVYGGAGGYGTRISRSTSVASYGSGSTYQYDDSVVIGNEKGTMQNLNDRLATYLEKVRTLEAANRQLELQIRECYEKKTLVSRDFSGYLATIAELQAKIARGQSQNHSVILQLDNAQLAAEDFKMKYEMEMNMRLMVEADLHRLRGVRDSLSISISDMEMHIEGLRQDLAYTKTKHQEDIHVAREQHRGSVNVEVDSAESADLAKILQEMRDQYEATIQKNKQEIEKWFQLKMDALQTEITVFTTDIKTFQGELSELKRTYQREEINREGIITEIQCLQQNYKEVNSRFSVQLQQIQMTINMLEVELQQLRTSLEQQKSDYNLLLDIKMRLEMEIAEYRRLLEGEHYERKAVVISKVVEVEEHKPHIERRVKTIVEEIVDGKIVSSTVDTQVEDLQ